MTPQEEQTIRDWHLKQDAPVTLFLARGQGEADERLTAFCDRFKAAAPGARLRNAPDRSFRNPALIIGRHANIAYQAVPEGRELDPFLEALSAAALEEAKQAKPRGLDIALPAELVLYIAMQCPYCPQTVQQLTALAETNAALRIAIVDGLLFGQEARAQGIRSVPTLILDDHLRWVGRIDMQEVIDQCIRRDPAQLSPASLRRMLEAGDAARAAALMIDYGRIFPALIDLLIHENWSVRLGAMVTVEYMADQAPELADRLAAPLWQRFDALPESVQGDVVQVLGQIASETARSRLRQIVTGDFADSVRQAAAEELGDA
jgi:Thioredoxin domain